MAEQALYVPHSVGQIIGLRRSRPWLARNADQAIATPWRGQPAFTDPADAFAWLDWARRQTWLPGGLAVAHTDVHTEPTAEGIHRVHIGAKQLRDAANQVLRPHPATAGPDHQVLAACHGIARVEAAHTWLIDQAGATAHHRTGAALSRVWEYGYRLAARDARAALAGHIARTVKAAQADLPPNRDGGEDSGREVLSSLDRAAATLAAAAALVLVPDLPATVADPARATLHAGGELGGWDAATGLVWNEALRTGALDAIVGAATDIETWWRANPDSDALNARVHGRPAQTWVAETLVDANRAVASQWLLATAQPHPPAPPQPHTGDPPPSPVEPPDPLPGEPAAGLAAGPPPPAAARAFIGPSAPGPGPVDDLQPRSAADRHVEGRRR